MNDPIVTHADLNALRGIRMAATDRGSYYRDDLPAKPGALTLLDRLIAAAEADRPPLPEGWVLTTQAGVERVLWHRGDGSLFPQNDLSHEGISARGGRSTVSNYDSVTPLRPTVTEADVERAVEAHWSLSDCDAWERETPRRRASLIKQAHEFLGELGIEVQP